MLDRTKDSKQEAPSKRQCKQNILQGKPLRAISNMFAAYHCENWPPLWHPSPSVQLQIHHQRVCVFHSVPRQPDGLHSLHPFFNGSLPLEEIGRPIFNQSVRVLSFPACSSWCQEIHQGKPRWRLLRTAHPFQERAPCLLRMRMDAYLSGENLCIPPLLSTANAIWARFSRTCSAAKKLPKPWKVQSSDTSESYLKRSLYTQDIGCRCFTMHRLEG